MQGYSSPNLIKRQYVNQFVSNLVVIKEDKLNWMECLVIISIRVARNIVGQR